MTMTAKDELKIMQTRMKELKAQVEAAEKEVKAAALAELEIFKARRAEVSSPEIFGELMDRVKGLIHDAEYLGFNLSLNVTDKMTGKAIVTPGKVRAARMQTARYTTSRVSGTTDKVMAMVRAGNMIGREMIAAILPDFNGDEGRAGHAFRTVLTNMRYGCRKDSTPYTL